MPPEPKAKSVIRVSQYNRASQYNLALYGRPKPMLQSLINASLQSAGNPIDNQSALTPASPEFHANAFPLAPHWESGQRLLERPSEFANKLSEYLRSKNEAYKRELGNMEEALNQAEETSKTLRETVVALGETVDKLEDTMSAAAHILSSSLGCAICFEICSNPTSLKCGHSFCRSCLQSYFLSKFESRCEDYRIKLDRNEYSYVYRQAATGDEAEQNMLKFAALSNRIKPNYCCPSCRDLLLPSLRNSFADFKLTASLSSLSALISYNTPASPPDWKVPGIDFLGFFNSRFFRRQTVTEQGHADNAEVTEDDI